MIPVVILIALGAWISLRVSLFQGGNLENPKDWIQHNNAVSQQDNANSESINSSGATSANFENVFSTLNSGSAQSSVIGESTGAAISTWSIPKSTETISKPVLVVKNEFAKSFSWEIPNTDILTGIFEQKNPLASKEIIKQYFWNQKIFCYADLCLFLDKPLFVSWSNEELYFEQPQWKVVEAIDDYNNKWPLHENAIRYAPAKKMMYKDTYAGDIFGWMRTLEEWKDFKTLFVKRDLRFSCLPVLRQSIIASPALSDTEAATKLNIPDKLSLGSLHYSFQTVNIDRYIEHDLIVETTTSNPAIDLSGIKTVSREMIVKFTDIGVSALYSMNSPDWISGNYSYSYAMRSGQSYLLLSGNLSEWPVTDLDLTKKIFGQYYSDRSLWIAPKNWGYDEIFSGGSLNSTKLPFFTLTKIAPWYFALSVNKDYEVIMMAEFCKPAIYSYDKDNQENSVTIGFNPFGWEFTHLDPVFNILNWWKFRSDNGKVVVNDWTYDYLYYAARVGKYQFNTDWYLVQWKDITLFFNDKLTKLAFKENEKKDFIEYWLEKFEENQYYMISFKYNEQIDKYLTLNFQKNARTLNRVMMEAVKIDKPQNGIVYSSSRQSAFDQLFLRKLHRDPNFDIFEWGGVFVEDNSITVY